MADKREELIMTTASAICRAAEAGIFGGMPVTVYRAETIAGPRAGAVRLYAGLATGPLFRALSADNCALARQFIAWRFTGEPAVYLDGQTVRVEAAWPPELAQAVIRLRQVCRKPMGGGRWVLGVNEVGQTVIGGLCDRTPSWLLGGTTGSGKTVALLGAALQLSRQVDTQLIVVDGKAGAGLAPLAGLRGMVGPLAADAESARAALGWANAEMKRRYEVLARDPGAQFPRLVMVFDEFQEMTDDPLIRELLRRIVRRGRQAHVHALLATQHPTRDAFGDDASIKRNLPGRLALKVLDAKASEVVIGAALPRADRLLGAGDAYAIGSAIHRTQVVLVDAQDFDAAERAEPLLAEWPEVEPADVGQEPTVNWSYTGTELAIALGCAVRGQGRRVLESALTRIGPRPGVTRATRLLQLARSQYEALPLAGIEVVEREPASEDGEAVLLDGEAVDDDVSSGATHTDDDETALLCGWSV